MMYRIPSLQWLAVAVAVSAAWGVQRAGAAWLLKGPHGPIPPAPPEIHSSLPRDWARIPMVFPVAGRVEWHDCYNQPRSRCRHTGIDIAAPKMRPILAPISGILGFKIFSFWIVGEGRLRGWQVLGTHLNDDTPGTRDHRCHKDMMFAPNLRRGDRVEAGQLIGYVGDSGNATGPHLHLELHGPRGVRDPTPSLKHAAHRDRPRCLRAEPEEVPLPGQVRLDGCPRGYDPVRRILTIQLVARQAAGKAPTAAMRPQRTRVQLTEEAEEALGGCDGIRALPRDRAIRVYVTKYSGPVLAARVAVDPDTPPQMVRSVAAPHTPPSSLPMGNIAPPAYPEGGAEPLPIPAP